jgi:integrase
VLTLPQLARRFVEAREEANKLAHTTASEYRRMIVAYLDDAKGLAHAAAAEIAPADLQHFLTTVARERGPSIGNRLFQLVRAVLRWAARPSVGLLKTAPPLLERPAKETPRERTLSDAEVAVLWTTLGSAPPVVAGAVKLLLLLGQRSSETALMRWRDVDLEARPPLWTIPGEFRKGGRAHAVPLSPQAARVIEALQRSTGTQERVFHGLSVANEERNWWGSVREAAIAAGPMAGVAVEHFTRHDLRRTCASGCARLGASPHVVSRLLGHATPQGTVAVSNVYNRFAYIPEIAAALTAWGAHVERLASSDRRRARVVAIRRRHGT